MRPALIRPYASADREACIDLYRLNEPGRFPPGILPEFERGLHNGTVLTLIAEEGGAVVGCGGIAIRTAPSVEVAGLSFGLIHPARHGQGFGTSLLIARLSLVPKHIPLAVLMPVQSSQSFYERFGFRYRCEIKISTGIEMPVFATKLTPRLIERCETVLRHAGVVLPEGEISLPVVPDEVR